MHLKIWRPIFLKIIDKINYMKGNKENKGMGEEFFPED